MPAFVENGDFSCSFASCPSYFQRNVLYLICFGREEKRGEYTRNQALSKELQHWQQIIDHKQEKETEYKILK